MFQFLRYDCTLKTQWAVFVTFTFELVKVKLFWWSDYDPICAKYLYLFINVVNGPIFKIGPQI